MSRIVRRRLLCSDEGCYRLARCDCFDPVPLPALVKIDLPQFNLIIAACAPSDSSVSGRGRHAFERQPFFSPDPPRSAASEMDIFYLILRERSHRF